jgi:rare lipoprotein A
MPAVDVLYRVQHATRMQRSAWLRMVGSGLVALWLIGCTSLPPAPVAAVVSAPSVASQNSAPSKVRAAQPADAVAQTATPQVEPSLGESQQLPGSVIAPSSTDDAQPATSSQSGVLSLWQEVGIASWYGPGFQGKRTANGERFDTRALTAAHKTLPFGTRVRVKSLADGKEVVVRINDRGPFIAGRIIDLSRAAAQALGMRGIKRVELERLP